MDGYVDPALRMLERCVNAPRKALVGNWVHDFPDDGLPRTEPRLAPRDGPLLRPLAEGHRQRGDGRAGADVLPPRLRPAGALSGGLARRLAERAVVPATGRLGDVPVARSGSGAARRAADARAAGRGRDRSLPTPGDDRDTDRPVVGLRQSAERAGPRPPARRCARPDLHQRAAGRADRDPRLRRRRAWPSRRRCRSRPPSSGWPTSRPTGPRPRSPPASSTSPTATRTRSPTPLEPGRVYEVRIPLRAAGYRFAPGHRIRLSVATNYWPVLWPSPFPGELAVHHAPIAAHPADDPARRRLACRHRHSRRPRPVSRSIGGGTSEPPVWRIVEDVIAGHGHGLDQRRG